MPKDRGVNPLASIQARASPRACHSNDSNSNKLETSSTTSLAESEWEETRCPICMEHPHNAVLLVCSSREKGCQPYMCDTSYRHSNCLDQFRKSFPVVASDGLPNDESVTRMHYRRGAVRGSGRSPLSNMSLRGEGVELMCPLCRGQIFGWVVVEAARKYMNSKTRSCSLESCEFAGNYAELRKHARHEHPSLRPSEADPQRQSDWARLERRRDLGDTLSAYPSQFVPDLNGDDLFWSNFYQDDDFTMDVQSEGGNLFDHFFSGSDSAAEDGQSGTLFDHFFTGIDSAAEDEQSDHENTSVDLSYEIEFSFSFLSDISLCPWDDGRNHGSGRSSSSGLFNGRPTRPRTRSVNHGEETITTPRSRRSRHTPYFSPRRGLD